MKSKRNLGPNFVSLTSRFIQSLVGKIIGKLAILEIMLFDKLSNEQRTTSGIADVFKW